MTKISELTTKVTPIGADLVTGLDSADGDINTQNKNFTLDSIGTLAFSDKTTDDLPEGSTNKYYSDALVDANATVISKADKSNVIEKDSTTPFTPTLPTHPVNKDYADTMTIPDATNIVKGKIRIATDAESSTGTDELTSINPKQLKDRQFVTTEGQVILRGNNGATATIVYSHSLGVTPKSIRFDAFKGTNVTCHGVYDGINNSFVMPSAASTNITSITHSIRSDGGSSHQLGAVTAVTSTNFSITWTAVSSPSAGNIAILATLSI